MNILNEDATTNLCTNPSAETTDTNVVMVNPPTPPATPASTVKRSNEQAWVGNYSFKFVNTASAVEAYRVGSQMPSGAGQTFTASAWMFIQSGSFRIRVGFRDSGGSVVGGQSGAYTSATGGWVRLTATATSPANTANVEIVIGTNAAGVAYIDALQLEEKPSATSYADGSLGFGYAWTGTPHSSSSTRAAGVLAADGSITARDINSFGSVTATGSIKPGSFTRSRLPVPGVEGRLTYAIDGVAGLRIDNGLFWHDLLSVVNVQAAPFRAIPDGVVINSASITSGSNVVTLSGASLTSADIGKVIEIKDARASSGSGCGRARVTRHHHKCAIIHDSANLCGSHRNGNQPTCDVRN